MPVQHCCKGAVSQCPLIPPPQSAVRRVAQVTPLPAAAARSNRDLGSNPLNGASNGPFNGAFNGHGPVNGTNGGGLEPNGSPYRIMNGRPGLGLGPGSGPGARVPGTPPLKPRNPQHFNTLPAKPRVQQLSVYDNTPEVRIRGSRPYRHLVISSSCDVNFTFSFKFF